MADKKISELTNASVVNPTDVFVIVQSGETRIITPTVLFKNVPVSILSKELPEIVESGVISTTIQTTAIDASSFNDVELTLAAATNGSVKEIVCLNLIPSYVANITVTNGRNVEVITLHEPGDAVTLKYIQNYWYVMNYKGATFV